MNFRTFTKHLSRDFFLTFSRSTWFVVSTWIFILFPGNLKARVFRHFSKGEGAPKTTVLGITQDQMGFMWFATSRGLFRYDSKRFKKYGHEPGNPGSIPSDYVQNVFCDSQNNIWVATRFGIGLFNPDKETFTTFRHDPDNAASLSSDEVNFIAEDSRRRLWVGTSKGLDELILDNDKASFVRKSVRQLPGNPGSIRSFAEGKDGDLWLGTSDGLVRWCQDQRMSKVYRPASGRVHPGDNFFWSVHVDEQGAVWAGTRSGLLKFDAEREKFYFQDRLKRSEKLLSGVSGIIDAGNGLLWVATEAGLALHDPGQDKTEWFHNQKDNPRSLTDDVLYSMFLDRSGGLWLGSYYLGISFTSVRGIGFSMFPADREGAGRDFSNAWMGKTADDRIFLIAGNQRKIAFCDARGQQSAEFDLPSLFVGDYHYFYVDSQGVLWCGGTSMLTQYDLKSRVRRDFPLAVKGRAGPGKGRIYSLLEDSQGRFWVAGSFGILRFDRENGSFYDGGFDKSCYTAFEDTRGNLWFGRNHGVLFLKKGTEHLESLPVDSAGGPGKFMSARRISEDPSGQIWIAAEEHLLLYDKSKHRLVRLPGDEDKKIDYALDVISDRSGFLWINAESKLIRYHPKTRQMQVYDERDGLPVNSVLQLGTSVEDEDGRLYFVTNNGNFTFDPADVEIHTGSSGLVLTAVKLFGREVPVGDRKRIMDMPVEKADKLTFRHDQNILTLDFALRSFVRSHRNQYAFRLDGFEEEWNYVQNPSANYTNLPAGDYIFMVKAANGDGHWVEDPLKIQISVLPPWWKTWYFYTFFFLFFIAKVYAVNRFLWLRNTFRKENQLYQAKIDFFTNISHEIRTHLSLVRGPLEKAFSLQNDENVVKKHLTYACNNSEKLMLLVNELLDFRKMQTGGVRLRVNEYDVVKVLKSVLASFEHLAAEKGIETNFEHPNGPVCLWFDLGQMQKVFYNLLSNAYKFTPEGGAVSLTVTEISNEVAIRFADNGRGIAPAYLKDLFSNFFQVHEGEKNNGHGIGLALSKEIVDRHKGYLTVTSQLSTEGRRGGSCFTLRLLTGCRHFEDDQIGNAGTLPQPVVVQPVTTNGVSSPPGVVKKHSILLIEDNDELRAFTKEIFDAHYHVLDAPDGHEGLKLAKAEIPDLILCDVMMPGLNGLEVARSLKSDMPTSHIPVILLTARSELSQVIDGLETGADDYLVKPFDPTVLELKIANLIRIRESLKEQYSRCLSLEPADIVINDLDGEFLERMKNLVVDNLSNVDFGVSEMAFQMGTSVSVLYRKLRSLTGMTVNEFMKTIRMKRALQLLESGAYHVSEVATIVGFDDTKYFSREFRKVYGKTPSEVRRQTADEKGRQNC